MLFFVSVSFFLVFFYLLIKFTPLWFSVFLRPICKHVLQDCMNRNKDNVEPTIKDASPFGKLSEDLLIEIFIRVPITNWDQISCVRKQWATLFRGECLWQAALYRVYPLAIKTKRWIGPIRQGLSKR